MSFSRSFSTSPATRSSLLKGKIDDNNNNNNNDDDDDSVGLIHKDLSVGDSGWGGKNFHDWFHIMVYLHNGNNNYYYC